MKSRNNNDQTYTNTEPIDLVDAFFKCYPLEEARAILEKWKSIVQEGRYDELTIADQRNFNVFSDKLKYLFQAYSMLN